MGSQPMEAGTSAGSTCTHVEVISDSRPVDSRTDVRNDGPAIASDSGGVPPDRRGYTPHGLEAHATKSQRPTVVVLRSDQRIRLRAVGRLERNGVPLQPLADPVRDVAKQVGFRQVAGVV